MKKMAILTFVLLLCVGCGKSDYEKAQEQVDKNMKEMKKELEKIGKQVFLGSWSTVLEVGFQQM